MSAARKAAGVVGELACELQALVAGFHRAEQENYRLRRLLRDGLDLAAHAADVPSKAEAHKRWRDEVTRELVGSES